IAELQEKYRKSGSGMLRTWYEKYMRRGLCPQCKGARLNAQACNIRLTCRPQDGLIEDSLPALHELCSLPVDRIMTLLDSLELTPIQHQIADEILKELRARLQFLLDVGLHYLTLDRTAPTLSGGEAQRIRLAGQIGSGLTGVLYVLDEPSI